MRIRLLPLWVFGFALAILGSWVNEARAQAPTFPAKVQINYVLPTKNTDGTDIAATGATALVKAQFWLSTATIPSNTTAPANAEVTALGTLTTTQTLTASVGQTVFVRARFCNALTCSDFTNEATGVVTAPKPGSGSITIVINVGP